jgi:hypothetical protein
MPIRSCFACRVRPDRRNSLPSTSVPALRSAALLIALLAIAAPASAQVAPADASTTSTAPAAPEVKSAWDAPEPWRTDRFYVQTSLVTVHFNPDPDHDNTTNLIDLNWRLSQRWLEGQVFLGASFFDNSFGQNSQYVYGGLLWRPFETAQPLYFKLTAGVLHGYSGEYQNKIPFNSSGYAPGIVPSVGYCYNRFCSELVIFGTAGAMLTLGMTAP